MKNEFWKWFGSRLLALWRYRGFVFGMVWREFHLRYLGSLLGSAWSVLHPIAMIFIYTVIFSKIMRARLPGVDDNMGFGIFLCAGLLPWSFFSELLGRCPNIFIEQANLLKKGNFPRITFPVVLFLSSTVNFVIIFTVFLLFLLVTGRYPDWSFLAFVPLLLLQQFLAMGLGIMLGALNVFFRDVGQFVGIVLQFWFWFTPIIYPITILPQFARELLKFNPMTQLVLSYQQIVLFGNWPQWSLFKAHIVFVITTLLISFVVFRKLSAEIVDEL